MYSPSWDSCTKLCLGISMKTRPTIKKAIPKNNRIDAMGPSHFKSALELDALLIHAINEINGPPTKNNASPHIRKILHIINIIRPIKQMKPIIQINNDYPNHKPNHEYERSYNY